VQSRVASASRGVGSVAALLFAGVPALIQIGLLKSALGFPLFLLGGLLGLVALVLGLIGLARTRAGSGREGRGRALAGTVLGAAILAVVVVAAGPSSSLPPINDITTSPDDPPAFVKAQSFEPNQGRDMGYPGGDFAEQQRAGYPDLAPIQVASPPLETLDRVGTLVAEFGWEETDRDAAGGRLEASDTSAIFRFVDDIVVRVRPAGSGSVVDVRSKSREGRGDLGANAERIRKLQEGLSR